LDHSKRNSSFKKKFFLQKQQFFSKKKKKGVWKKNSVFLIKRTVNKIMFLFPVSSSSRPSFSSPGFGFRCVKKKKKKKDK
jgi:hypothetical protein